MKLKKGKTKTLLNSSINCALIAVELYNKPRAPFRVESFITHMIMAWTRLFQAFFNQEYGEIYFYKKDGARRYDIVDGEKRAWDLKKCISVYKKLPDPVIKNLLFFINLRNKIEHFIIDKEVIGISIFGECQALLYNYETELINLFGPEYALNESLAYSLQFSRIRTPKQIDANKQLLSNDCKKINEYIQNYKADLKYDVYSSPQYSIRVIQIPKISNTKRSDLAIEFVNWNSLSNEDKKNYEKVIAIIKDKTLKIEAINTGKLKPSHVINKLKSSFKIELNNTQHTHILATLGIRPFDSFKANEDPYNTNINFCHYDEVHKDYIYKPEWIDFLAENIKNGKISTEICKKAFYKKEKIDINTII